MPKARAGLPPANDGSNAASGDNTVSLARVTGRRGRAAGALDRRYSCLQGRPLRMGAPVAS
jgi:hypothetical protein